jgi:hypothetical protein
MHHRAPRLVSERFGDLGAFQSHDLYGILCVIGNEAARYLAAALADDRDRLAAGEMAFHGAHTGSE